MFIKIEKKINNNPSLLLESPRIGRKLPELLTIEEIDNMISEVCKPEWMKKAEAEVKQQEAN